MARQFTLITHIRKSVQSISDDYFPILLFFLHLPKLLTHYFQVVPIIHQSVVKKVMERILLGTGL